MKTQDSAKPQALGRRAWLGGAATAGVAAAAVAALPKVVATDAAQPVAQAAKPDDQAGYQETEHVKRYYQTARI